VPWKRRSYVGPRCQWSFVSTPLDYPTAGFESCRLARQGRWIEHGRRLLFAAPGSPLTK
jgi:hypothetical protein